MRADNTKIAPQRHQDWNELEMSQAGEEMTGPVARYRNSRVTASQVLLAVHLDINGSLKHLDM